MLHDASSESSSNDRTLDHEANSLARSLIASAKIEPRLYPKEEEENLSRWKIANRKHGDTTSGKNIGVAPLRNPGTASWQMVRKPSSCKCIPVCASAPYIAQEARTRYVLYSYGYSCILRRDLPHRRPCKRITCTAKRSYCASTCSLFSLTRARRASKYGKRSGEK